MTDAPTPNTQHGPRMLRDTIKQNQDRWLKQLTEFLAIPSISTLPDHAADCRKAADWLMTELRRLGCPKVELLEGRGTLRRCAFQTRRSSITTSSLSRTSGLW